MSKHNRQREARAHGQIEEQIAYEAKEAKEETQEIEAELRERQPNQK